MHYLYLFILSIWSAFLILWGFSFLQSAILIPKGKGSRLLLEVLGFATVALGLYTQSVATIWFIG